jgi:large subunit ribosomal protein L35
MPKIKTNRTAHKKFSINKNGKIKRAGAHHSHKTANKSPKQRRNLRKNKIVDAKDAPAIKRQLPYA